MLFFEDIYRQNASTRGNLWGSVVEEFGVVDLVFAYHEREVSYVWLKIIIQDSQVPFWRLYWTRKVKLESKRNEDVFFKVHEPLPVDHLLLLFSKVINHPLEVRRYWLFQLSSQENAYSWQTCDLWFLKVSYSQRADISVENVGSQEKGLDLIFLLFMQINYYLHSIGPLISVDNLIHFERLGLSFRIYKWGLFFISYCGYQIDVKIVAHLKGLLITAESEIALLGILGMVLMSLINDDALVESWIFLYNVISIDLWDR